MPPKLDIEEVKAILAASEIIASWQVVIEDETDLRALYRIRCRVLRAAYQLEIRFIQTENETLYSYQLFADRSIIRWDNAPHFPALRGFPHHFHDESGEVKDSPLVGLAVQDLPYVLEQVRGFLAKPSF
ncbi:MAG: hypothetical protein HYT78_04395 [Deltaproteobacteria bacterium]|nr:hypothetical protein [Deltaproteobacteria bacterium]